MKLVSWNVNGLRAAAKKGFLDWLYETDADIVGLQETKAEPDQLPDDVRVPRGYHAFFSHPKTKKGYSGVALYTKQKPDKVEYSIELNGIDDEGRIVIGHFGEIVLLNVYFPNGGGGPERLKFKLDFYDAFLTHVEKLRKKGKNVIFCGDINTAHEEIDLARPKANETNTGFLTEERAWLDEVANHGWIDTFRHFYPNKTGAYSYWDMKSAARERNVGWRIDYFFVAPELLQRLKAAGIMANIYGSDHCPVWVDISEK
jgi:exodeoxyribonuclease III